MSESAFIMNMPDILYNMEGKISAVLLERNKLVD